MSASMTGMEATSGLSYSQVKIEEFDRLSFDGKMKLIQRGEISLNEMMLMAAKMLDRLVFDAALRYGANNYNEVLLALINLEKGLRYSNKTKSRVYGTNRYFASREDLIKLALKPSIRGTHDDHDGVNLAKDRFEEIWYKMNVVTLPAQGASNLDEALILAARLGRGDVTILIRHGATDIPMAMRAAAETGAHGVIKTLNWHWCNKMNLAPFSSNRVIEDVLEIGALHGHKKVVKEAIYQYAKDFDRALVAAESCGDTAIIDWLTQRRECARSGHWRSCKICK